MWPPLYEEQLDHFGVDRGSIMGLLILHSHFDHTAAAPYFKHATRGWRLWPLMLAANNDIALYFNSLEQMAVLELKAVFCEHGGAFYEEDAASFLRQGVRLTRGKSDFYLQTTWSGTDAGKRKIC